MVILSCFLGARVVESDLRVYLYIVGFEEENVVVMVSIVLSCDWRRRMEIWLGVFGVEREES